MLSRFSCVQLCDPMDCSLPDSSVHGILRARILEWVAISSSMGSSRPRDRTRVSCTSCIGRQVLYHERESVGWHHRLDGHEFEQVPGVGDGQGGLACCSPWGHKESDMTE